MITDVSGVTLYPGDGGRECLGNGQHRDEKGHLIECCCDECDYLLCCCEGCIGDLCMDSACPRKQKSPRA